MATKTSNEFHLNTTSVEHTHHCMNGMRDETRYHWCIDSVRVMIRFYFRCFVVVVITETIVHIVWEVLVQTKPLLKPFVLHIDL